MSSRLSKLPALAARWQESQRVVVLTGAGISTASGVPDFRSPGGLWENYQPVPLQDFLASEASREEYWSYKGETWRLIQKAQPNAAHDSLVALANEGRLQLLLTQNVDGLHERSGFPRERLVLIHGSDAEVVCFACGAREPREAAQAQWEAGTAVPLCGCGGPWKPATISFGQGLVPDDLRRAMTAARDCDLFVAIGTSLVVGPINEMFGAAHAAGAATAILTASETPFDDQSDWRIADPVEQTLPAIREAMNDGG